MPSVEMRRSTRVFVPKSKDGELGRVLRSGRKQWVDSSDVKNKDWFPLKQHKINGWHGLSHVAHGHPVRDPMDVDEIKPPVFEISDSGPICRDEKKMYGKVYSRKRKRNLGGFVDESKKFGLHFVRRKKRRSLVNNCGGLWVILEGYYCDGCDFISSVLSNILKYVGEGRVGLDVLSGFLVSKPISTVFASSGVHFLWNREPIKSKGVCRIVGVRRLTAMFAVDFMVAPQCFQHIYFSLLIRSVRLSCLCLIHFPRENENDGTDEPLPYINDQNLSSRTNDVSDEPTQKVRKKIENSPGIVLALAVVGAKDVKPVRKFSGAGKTCIRNVPVRVGVLTRSSSKRRRRSLSSRRARDPLDLALENLSSPPESANLVSLKKQPVTNHVSSEKTVPALPSAPRQVLRRSARKICPNEIQVQNPSPPRSNVDINSRCCSANILVVESDKCYRVEGAEVMLEVSASNECHLVVKKDGLTWYSFKVERETRFGGTNRFTHACIWSAENRWKLEFPDRKEWVVFKELYKVCEEKNIVPTSPLKIIPIPEVCEVKNQLGTSCVFKRPKSYIKMTSDELSRTLSGKTVNYDMDSEDEEWLRNFNRELDASYHISDMTFELMICSFEKASYCNPEDVSYEKVAASFCLDLGSVEVAEPVYAYWVKKRKQKCAPLLRVFQLYQPMRPSLISKPVLRKRRSLKRPTAQSIQRGRGKDSILEVERAVEQCATEEHSAMLRVQEAKASAEKSVELAILKRQRAQLLMENADLAMYRATMALRIADAAAEILDSQQAANHFLDSETS